jgi:hypothetical protein
MGSMKDQLGDQPYQPQPKSPALEAKKLGMERVDLHADEDWKEVMLDLVKKTAKEREFFTSDHVFELFEASGSIAETHDRRAFGPIMLQAAKLGICDMAYCPPVNSNRASLHASPRRVWRSLIFARKPPAEDIYAPMRGAPKDPPGYAEETLDLFRELP